MKEFKLNCEVHGYIKDEQVRIIKIKGREYIRCRECQKEKDKKFSKTYRNQNKEYYKNKKKEHYKLKPEMQIARNRKYRKKLKRPDSSTGGATES